MKPFLFKQHGSRGFTLMEMLVAVTIVLLIMIMLAEVFELATGAMVKQKGTAENDQQARTFTTILKEDLRRRTFLDVVPFYPRSESELIETAAQDERRGYFYYAENNPANQQDDVLAFTIFEIEDGRRFLGRAAFLRDPNVLTNTVDEDLDGNPDDAGEAEPKNYLLFEANQPEGDDGYVIVPKAPATPGNPFSSYTDSVAPPNGLGMSKYAEVVYFLRGTNLHRRVLLLRDPFNPADTTDFTPSYVNENYPGSGANVYAPPSGSGGNAQGEFYLDFDYSAYYEFLDDGSTRDYNGPRFNSRESLNNFPTTLEQLGELQVPLSIGAPFRRFGHQFLDGLSVTLAPQGRPREFVRRLNGSVQEDANGNGWLDPGEDLNGNGVLDDVFIGRFLTQETEDADFNYPGAIVGTSLGTPITTVYNRTDLTFNPITFEVNELAGNTQRRGEDILMTNVTEFDVQILDDGLPTPKFVNLGHSENVNVSGTRVPLGFYNITRNQSFVDSNNDGLLGYTYNTTTKRFQLSEPLLYGNRYDTWYARKIQDLAGTELPPDLFQFQRPPYRPYAPGADAAIGELFGPWIDLNGDNLPDFYDRVPIGSLNGTYDAPSDINTSGSIELGTDEEGDALAIDQYGFPGSDDIPYPAKAIKVTVSFVDPTSKLIRQVTIIESLLNQ